jgi:hypothetical protein
MSQRFIAVVVAVLTLAFAGQAFALCQTQKTGFSATARGGIEDLNDLGAIHMDADNGGQWPTDCAKLAHDALLTKLKTAGTGTLLPNYFKETLVGYKYALIFAAAQRIAANGWFNTSSGSRDSLNTLAGQLDRAMTEYAYASHAGGCGTGFDGNSCMDDYAGAAAAYAWMAAYRLKAGYGDSGNYVNTAKGYINSFFANVCIHNPYTWNGTSVCNGTYAQLGGMDLTGQAFVLSFEHGFESPHYGLGITTSIVSAIVGIEAAGSSVTLTTEQKVKVRAMLREVQTRSDKYNNFVYMQNCWNADGAPGAWYWGPDNDCKDFEDEYGDGYDPKMYRLADFFAGHVGGNQVGGSDEYQSTHEYPWLRKDNISSAWGAGRYTTYYDQGWRWYTLRAGGASNPRYMPGDNPNVAPKGWIDVVNNSGVASGWACDVDAPNGWVKVDLYADGVKIPDNHQEQYGWWDSEQEVANACGGGYAHRFYIQLPSTAVGKNITGKVRDYTVGPDGDMGCGEVGGCRW